MRYPFVHSLVFSVLVAGGIVNAQAAAADVSTQSVPRKAAGTAGAPDSSAILFNGASLAPLADQSRSAAQERAQPPVPAAAALPPQGVPAVPPLPAGMVSSNVFGAQLFTGAFAQQGASQFNPDYVISNGDQIQIRLWGGFSLETVATVDPQGNIFLPQVGVVKVQGVHNNELQSVIENHVRRVFRANVFCYASLAAAQPVRVFVGGFVKRPGLYNGTSMDSLLHYIDSAGGIDPDRGSFINIQVKRGMAVRSNVNLYDFMLRGTIPLVQLADGDVIFITPRQNTVSVAGLADNANQFEFNKKTLTLEALSELARPTATATHVRVIRNAGTTQNVEYYPIANAAGVEIGNGDKVEYTADKKPGTITVRVEGEHNSAQEYVLPYGARLGELMSRIAYSNRSDTRAIQLFRGSVHDRQKAALLTSLKTLEATVLTARSGTSDEATLRKEEADLMMQWVERAKTIEPTGQVLIAQSTERNELLLENGDIIRVPTRDGLVLVSGEVLFPNTIAHDNRLTVEGYIKLAGGFRQNGDNSRVVVAHRDGSFEDADLRSVPKAGDQILVLPKVDVKSRQIFKELTQIIYQIAISARVVLRL